MSTLSLIPRSTKEWAMEGTGILCRYNEVAKITQYPSIATTGVAPSKCGLCANETLKTIVYETNSYQNTTRKTTDITPKYTPK